jgi:hypothetical protein
MLQRTLLSLIFSTLSLITVAQSGFEIGPAVQYQSTWLLNQDDTDAGGSLDYKNTFNMALGANLSYGFSARHGIRVGLYSSTQGQNYTTDETFVELPNTKYRTTLEYLNIPVLYRYNSDLKKSNTAFLLTVGPQFGILQSATADSLVRNFADSTASIKSGLDVMKSYNANDLSAALGLGMVARFNKHWHMNAMLNFTYSLSDIELGTAKALNRRPTQNAVVGLNISFYYLFNGPDMTTLPKLRD